MVIVDDCLELCIVVECCCLHLTRHLPWSNPRPGKKHHHLGFQVRGSILLLPFANIWLIVSEWSSFVELGCSLHVEHRRENIGDKSSNTIDLCFLERRSNVPVDEPLCSSTPQMLDKNLCAHVTNARLLSLCFF